MNEQTIKCPICNDPYVIYSMMCGDQSACPDCREKARQKIKKKSDIWNICKEPIKYIPDPRWPKPDVRFTCGAV